MRSEKELEDIYDELMDPDYEYIERDLDVIAILEWILGYIVFEDKDGNERRPAWAQQTKKSKADI